MLQLMPKASPLMERTEEEREEYVPQIHLSDTAEENWTRANALLDTVEELELIGPSVAPTDLLFRLFNEEVPRVFGTQSIQFGCTCSEDRVRQSLSIYSKRDIEKMTTDEGTVTADCQFCSAHYVLDPATLGFDREAAGE